MKKLIITVLFITLMPKGENIDADYLKVFEGEWQGTLTYLNYGDDETLVNLPVRMVAELHKGKLSFEYFYNEGNGRTEKRKDSFRVKGDKIYHNGKWSLESSELIDTAHWSLILTSKGKDNNRPASFRKTVNVTPERIQVEKWVLYEGEQEYFMRNRHIFEK